MPNKLNGLLLLLLLSVACTNNSIDKASVTIDTISLKTDSTPTVTTDTPITDVAIVSFARDSILHLLQTKDYAGFARFIGPEGILFSPYGMADTTKSKLISRIQYLDLVQSGKKFMWGFTDGMGDAIQLTIPQYFNKFVYDVPFLKAEQTSVDKVIDPDSTISNVPAVYGKQPFVQFYFPGFKKDYEGLDWKSLLLVFKQQQSKYYLVAVIHNQWKV